MPSLPDLYGLIIVFLHDIGYMCLSHGRVILFQLIIPLVKFDILRKEEVVSDLFDLINQ